MDARAYLATRIVRYLTLTVSVALALAVAVAFVPTLFGREVLVVTSGSMEPWASVGSVVVTRSAPAAAVGVGDVITFRPPHGATTTHRVIEVQARDANGSTFITQGDANEDPDPTPVRITGSVPKAERVLPVVGTILAAIRTPLAFLALVLLGLASALLEKASFRLGQEGRARPVLT